jgi:hypothetical protein
MRRAVLNRARAGLRRVVLNLAALNRAVLNRAAAGVWLIDSSPTAATGAPIGELSTAATS